MDEMSADFSRAETDLSTLYRHWALGIRHWWQEGRCAFCFYNYDILLNRGINTDLASRQAGKPFKNP
ncbi:MAG: hypothetical protein KAV00_06625, partial [Phycisphaerae bacterium]|nr:hypothetical protein [Phycisphaerae bacterium]